MKKVLFMLLLIAQTTIYSQEKIFIDGNFEDWIDIPIAIKDSADNVHDTDGYPEVGQPSETEVHRHNANPFDLDSSGGQHG